MTLLIVSYNLHLGYYCRSGAYIGTPEDHPENSTICPPGSFNFSDAGPCPAGMCV